MKTHREDVRSAADCRCPCGRLLARLTARGVEVKCGRCKRVQFIPAPPGWVGGLSRSHSKGREDGEK